MVSKEILDKLLVITDEERLILSGSEQIDRTIYMEGSRNTVVSRKLLENGKMLTVRPHTRFIHFPEHTHDYVEIVYMCQGTTTHIVNGTKLVISEGELLMMGQKTTQEICRAGRDDLAVNFIINPEFFRGMLPYFGEDETPLRRFIVDCLCGGRDPSYLYFKVADVLPIQHLLENLIWTLVEDVQNKRELNQMTFSLLFLLLINHTDKLHYASTDQQIMFELLRYVEENYRSCSLLDASAVFHYAPAALSKMIRRKTGKSYTQLVQEKRLAQAAWLLKNTTMNVNDISREVGYENIGYFHQLFAKRYQTTPKKYRDGL